MDIVPQNFENLMPLTNNSVNGFNESMANTITLDTIYYMYFTSIAMNLFEWSGKPFDEGTLNAEALEQFLFSDGRACFVEVPVIGPVNLRYSEVGKLNIYNLPKQIEAYSNDFHITKTIKEGFVLIRNNINYIPTALYVNHFAKIIQNIEATSQVNLQAQKTPVMFTGTNDQILTMKNMYLKYVGNVPYIFAKNEIDDAVKIGVFKTDAPFIADKLQELKRNYVSEFLSFIGINTAEEKKERLLTDEVNANNQYISNNFDMMYFYREKACKEFNKLFGAKYGEISVKPRTYSQILESDKASPEEMEEIDDGTLYNKS